MNNIKHNFKKNSKNNSKFKNKTHKRSDSKKQIVEVKCIGMDEEGKGIVIYKNEKVVIPYLLKGETASVEISKNGGTITGHILQIKKLSSYRVKPKCPYYNVSLL